MSAVPPIVIDSVLVPAVTVMKFEPLTVAVPPVRPLRVAFELRPVGDGAVEIERQSSLCTDLQGRRASQRANGGVGRFHGALVVETKRRDGARTVRRWKPR